MVLIMVIGAWLSVWFLSHHLFTNYMLIFLVMKKSLFSKKFVLTVILSNSNSSPRQTSPKPENCHSTCYYVCTLKIVNNFCQVKNTGGSSCIEGISTSSVGASSIKTYFEKFISSCLLLRKGIFEVLFPLTCF
jgi:hypothetical protein